MPVKMGRRLQPENAEARIEIIPLIDIMFFLLAAFMLVSLSMVHLATVKVNLPTATAANPDTTHDVIDLTVDKAGNVFIEKSAYRDDQLAATLRAQHKANPKLRVLISGDRDARHGDVIHVLDLVRSTGIDKVAFEIHHYPRGKS